MPRSCSRLLTGEATMTDQDAQSNEPATDLSVLDRVLTAFTTAVESEEGLADTAQRLVDTLITKKDLSEAAISQALFGGDPA